AAEPAKLLKDLAASTARTNTPLVTTFFGNPYTPTFMPELPAMLLTYDLYDLPERAAVRAIAGEVPINGKLPIAIPGLFPVGHGLERGRYSPPLFILSCPRRPPAASFPDRSAGDRPSARARQGRRRSQEKS